MPAPDPARALTAGNLTRNHDGSWWLGIRKSLFPDWPQCGPHTKITSSAVSIARRSTKSASLTSDPHPALPQLAPMNIRLRDQQISRIPKGSLRLLSQLVDTANLTATMENGPLQHGLNFVGRVRPCGNPCHCARLRRKHPITCLVRLS